VQIQASKKLISFGKKNAVTKKKESNTNTEQNMNFNYFKII